MVCAIDVIPVGRGAVQQSDDGQRTADDRAVYAISVAAGLVGTGVQNLRAYEARGLVEPGRTEGGTRRYSEQDISRLRRIAQLLDEGLNLAGIGLVLDLEAQNRDLRDENTVLRARRSPGRRVSTHVAAPTPEPAQGSRPRRQE
jgi:DNA-binding transcriptional MerR regulator